jgi:hypothetical protein
VAAFIAVLPLILHGCSCGHDFNFHLLNWMEVARQFSHGNLHPHWAFSPAYNAGEPRFVFYPPLSWTIGAILGLLMPWTWTPIVYTWLCLTAAGLALYRLAREFTSPQAALVAAAFYLVNPYTLFTAYERTAYAELLAATWIPLLLLSILRRRVTIAGIAIPVCLLWLTDDPAAVMGCYALALLALVRLFQASASFGTSPSLRLSPSNNASHKIATIAEQTTTPLRLAATITSGTLLGLGLAAFYIVPAAYEQRYVQIITAVGPGTRIQDNFLFQGLPNRPVLHTASTIAIVLLVLTAIAIAVAFSISIQNTRFHQRLPQSKATIAPMVILTMAIAVLLFPISSPIWQHTPELAFLQFPWRLLAILAAVLGLAIALVLTPLRLKLLHTAALSLLLTSALAYTGIHLFRQYCYPEDTVPASLTAFRNHTGTEPNNEYTPIAADNAELSHKAPPYWLIGGGHPDANAAAPVGTSPGSAPASLTLNPATPEVLVLNLRNYPAWRITLNGTSITALLHRSDGLIAFPIPAGLDRITITYAHTLNQTIGEVLTLISLALLLLTLKLQRRHKP